VPIIRPNHWTSDSAGPKRKFTAVNKKNLSQLFAVEFDNFMQQDAHEFLNFLINHISEIIAGKNDYFKWTQCYNLELQCRLHHNSWPSTFLRPK
jgi:uncharacterized UBP type Zn finger protein